MVPARHIIHTHFTHRDNHPSNMMGSSNSVSLSNKQHEQNQQAAPRTPLTTFKAATAALDTNELLRLIIAEVPPEYRTPLLRVSKA
jgi:hypothetical protein